MQASWERRLIELAGAATHSRPRPLSAYWAGNASLQNAYRKCAAITREHSKSFSLASGLLPKEKRSAIRALYAFCRTVDDIVDRPATDARDASLDYWRAQVRSAPVPDEARAVAAAWGDTLLRYDIPRRYALQLIDGVARDMIQTRYATFDDLSTYCYGVASTVGLMSMHIVGFESNDAIPYAIKLGVALQMTNILRDVGEDYRNGRVYLPLDEMEAFGVSEVDLGAGVVTNKWRELMRFEIARTRTLYAEAWPGIRILDRDGRLAIAAASSIYRGILDVIERNDYNVFWQRASVSTWSKIQRTIAVLPTL